MLRKEGQRFHPGIFGGFRMVAVRPGLVVKRMFGTLIDMVLEALVLFIRRQLVSPFLLSC